MEKKKTAKKKPENYTFKAVYPNAEMSDAIEDIEHRLMMLETIVICQDEIITGLENKLHKKNKSWWRLILGR